jgi:hypothetical protein
MLPRPFQMTKLKEEQLRALRILARHLDGCAEAALLAEGFSVSQLAVLVLEGLAEARLGEIVNRRKVWMQITEAGRKAIAH